MPGDRTPSPNLDTDHKPDLCSACEERPPEVCGICTSDIESYGFGKAEEKMGPIVDAFALMRTQATEHAAGLRRGAPPDPLLDESPQQRMRDRMIADAETIEFGLRALDALRGAS